jgi:hypothetical protein
MQACGAIGLLAADEGNNSRFHSCKACEHILAAMKEHGPKNARVTEEVLYIL